MLTIAHVNSETLFLLAADLILVTHVSFVAFVVFSLVLIVIGRFAAWRWVRNPWFRYAHLAAIGIVVLQSWIGLVCPLTTWEMALRERAGDAVYSGTFIAHWLQAILYYQAPAWVFAACYTLFALLVAGCWFWVRPFGFDEIRKPE